MCFVPRLNTERLANVLEENISKENGEYLVTKVFHTLQNKGCDITPTLHDKTVRWIWLLNQDFEYLPDTFSLTVSILDRFLSLVKVKPKYLRCIAITAYFLAIKTIEEDENIPSLTELVRVSECGCTASDVLRMERIILSKLQWNLNTTTPLSFLHLYNALVFSGFNKGNMAPNQHLNTLTVKLEDCLCNFQFTQFKGSVLSLALLSRELESLSPRWLAVVIKLQKITGIDFGDIIRCRELIHDVFEKNWHVIQMSTRRSRKSRPAYQHSLATIPEYPEDPFSYFPEHLQASMQTPILVSSACSFFADQQPLRDELKRLHSIAVGVLSDEDSTPLTKRRRAELAMACGQQSQQGCGVCTNGVHALQAVAL